MPERYWVELIRYEDKHYKVAGWIWAIKCINGKGGATSNKVYRNKAQCRNAATAFASMVSLDGLEVREGGARQKSRGELSWRPRESSPAEKGIARVLNVQR